MLSIHRETGKYKLERGSDLLLKVVERAQNPRHFATMTKLHQTRLLDTPHLASTFPQYECVNKCDWGMAYRDEVEGRLTFALE